jgi:hypothetical protein
LIATGSLRATQCLSKFLVIPQESLYPDHNTNTHVYVK